MGVGENKNKLSVRVELFKEGLQSFSNAKAKVSVEREFDVVSVKFRGGRSGTR